MNAKRMVILAVCCAAAGSLGATARAEDTQDTHFKIYGGAAYVAPMSDSDVTFNSVTKTVKAEQQVGWNLGIELDYVNATENV